MIYSFRAKNFYSIDEEMHLSFEVNKQAPKSNTYSSGENRVSLLEAIVGPNASGKTNIIKTLGFIRHLIVESGGRDVDADIPLVTFRSCEKPTELAVKFSVGDNLYTYDFELNSTRVLSEKLRKLSKSEERTTYKTLFSRVWDAEKNQYTSVDKVFGLPPTFKPRRNSSVISSVFRLNEEDPIAGEIVRYWRDSVVMNVWEGGNLDDHRIHGDHLTHMAISFFYDNPRLMQAAKDILKNIDVGFYDFRKEKLELEKKEILGIQHRYEDKEEFSIPLKYESSGTKRVVAILRFIIQALNDESGGLAAIDELDAYLHPDIVEALVKLFTSPDTNPNGAQLLFSSHSHQLLSEFDKQQIVLVEKDEKGKTLSWRLDEVSGVRADDNYYTKYIAGAYGARPKIGQ